MKNKKNKGIIGGNKSILQKAIESGKARIIHDGDGKVDISLDKKIKILAWGASPYVITGFGVVMRKLLQSLFRSYPGKYEVYQVGINHAGDAYNEFEITGGVNNGRYQQWPAVQAGSTKQHIYGQHKFLQLLHQIDLDFDVVFLFEDPFWVGGPVPGLNPPKMFVDEIKNLLNLKGKGHVPIVAYFPIDGVPRPQWIQEISKVDIPITYLNFGAQAVVQAAPSMQGRVGIIPHGVDTNDFHPISDREKRLFRRSMFGDDFANKFMFLNVNRNQLRKLVPSTLLAFREFQRRTNRAGFMYLNMKPQDVGWNLYQVCENLKLKIGLDVLFPPDFNVQKGLSQEQLNDVFSSSDLLVSTAVGGGWELAITQAFATKTPVLAPMNTSHTELCGDQSNMDTIRGMLFKSGDSLSNTIIFPHDNEVPRPLPNLEDMVDRMMFLYQNKEFRDKMADNAYNWAVNNLNWDRDVASKFDAYFELAKRTKDQRISNSFNPPAAPIQQPNEQKSKEITIPAGNVV